VSEHFLKNLPEESLITLDEDTVVIAKGGEGSRERADKKLAELLGIEYVPTKYDIK